MPFYYTDKPFDKFDKKSKKYKSTNILVTNKKNFFALLNGHSHDEVVEFVRANVFKYFEHYLKTKSIEESIKLTCEILNVKCLEMRKLGGCTVCLVYVVVNRCYVGYIGAWNLSYVDECGACHTVSLQKHVTDDEEERVHLPRDSLKQTPLDGMLVTTVKQSAHKYTRSIGDFKHVEIIATPKRRRLDGVRLLLISSGEFAPNDISALSSANEADLAHSKVTKWMCGSKDDALWCDNEPDDAITACPKVENNKFCGSRGGGGVVEQPLMGKDLFKRVVEYASQIQTYDYCCRSNPRGQIFVLDISDALKEGIEKSLKKKEITSLPI